MATAPESLLEDYLRRVPEIRALDGFTGDIPYFGAREGLLIGAAGTLKSAVIGDGQLRSQGPGHPEFKLYTLTQRRGGAPEAAPIQPEFDGNYDAVLRASLPVSGRASRSGGSPPDSSTIDSPL